MKKIFFALAIVTAAAVSSCGGAAGSLKSEADSLAYFAGANPQIVTYIRTIDSTMNLDTFMAGLKDALNHKQSADAETAYNFLMEYMTVRVPARNKEASEKFLSEIQTRKGVQKTESGLLYQIVEAGDEAVKASSDYDQVRVVYEGTLPNGSIFDSSKQRGDTAQFALNQVIRGWTEGMKLVGKGGKIKLWIPAEMAYGQQGTPSGIGPNQAIVFEVEMVDVIPFQPAQ